MTQNQLRLSACVPLMAAALVLAGCGGSGVRDGRLTASDVRRNPTPELDHVARSHAQVRNDHARIIDNNNRALWDDLDRMLLLDRTSRNQPLVLP